MKKWLLPFAACSLMFSTPVFAIDTYTWNPDHEKRFKAKDRNGDGTISKAEFLHVHNGQFDRLDFNSDNQISMAELQRYLEPKKPKHVSEKQWRMKADRHFGRKDLNKDNVISRDEYLSKHHTTFKGYDRDHDDNISEEEMRIYWDNEKKALQQFKDKKGRDD